MRKCCWLGAGGNRKEREGGGRERASLGDVLGNVVGGWDEKIIRAWSRGVYTDTAAG